jgi:FtsH-binding integral membrane protein
LEPEKQRSNWWYLLPIFFGIIGGIIAYFAIRKDDRTKAKKCLYLGLILLAVGIIIDVFLDGLTPIPDIWYGVNI